MQCAKCSKQVGCGCNLKGGLCGSCQPKSTFNTSVTPQAPVIHPQQGNRINPKPVYKPPVINRATWSR